MQITMMRDGTLLVIPDSTVEAFALDTWKEKYSMPEGSAYAAGIIVKTSSSAENSEELNEAIANLTDKY